MKYNVLREYRGELEREHSKATAETYYKAVDYLLNDQFLMDVKKIDIDLVLSKLKDLKYKNQYSKYKNAFIKFCAYAGIALDKKTLDELNRMSEDKKKKRRSLHKRKLIDITNKIKSIHDKKLRLSYRVMLATGLRVSELAQIKKEDCVMDNGGVRLSFVGKGKEQREQVTITSSQLVKSMEVLLDETPAGGHVFYSANYLQTEAKKRNFQCHDLRRAFSKLEYQKTKNINKVMKAMRHTKRKSTQIYLKSKIEI